VAKVLQSWTAESFEEACASAGLVATMTRSFAEWDVRPTTIPVGICSRSALWPLSIAEPLKAARGMSVWGLRQRRTGPIVEPGRSAILDANVLRFVRNALGDPRLTWWEANFVNGMANWVASTGPGAHLLTEKQWAIITQISDKLDTAPAEDLADAAEDEVTLPELASVNDPD